jgi:acyl-CoA reductase-like NAD-dependent aldehyde dehydrogenase
MATVAAEAEMLIEVRNPRTGKADFRLPVSSTHEIAAKAARLRNNQRGWEAMGVEGRCGVMARWLGVVKGRARDIGEADAVDTAGATLRTSRASSRWATSPGGSRMRPGRSRASGGRA